MVNDKSVAVRIRLETRARLDKLKHPGQSYDGVLAELLNFWEEHHALRRPKRPTPKPPEKGEPTKEDWWWPRPKS